MPREVGLDAVIRPTVDRQAVEREADRVGEAMDSAATVSPSVEGLGDLRRTIRDAVPDLGRAGAAARGGAKMAARSALRGTPIPTGAITGRIDRLGASRATDTDTAPGRQSGGGGGAGGGFAGDAAAEVAAEGLVGGSGSVQHDQLEKLEDIHDEIRKGNVSAQSGGGGSAGGTLLQGLGLRSILGGSGGGGIAGMGILSLLAGGANVAGQERFGAVKPSDGFMRWMQMQNQAGTAVPGGSILSGAYNIGAGVATGGAQGLADRMGVGEGYRTTTDLISETFDPSNLPSLTEALDVAGLPAISDIIDAGGMPSLESILGPDGVPLLSDMLDVAGMDTLAAALDIASMPALSDALSADSLSDLPSLLGADALPDLSDALSVGGLPTIDEALGFAQVPSLIELLGLGGGGGSDGGAAGGAGAGSARAANAREGLRPRGGTGAERTQAAGAQRSLPDQMASALSGAVESALTEALTLEGGLTLDLNNSFDLDPKAVADMVSSEVDSQIQQGLDDLEQQITGGYR